MSLSELKANPGRNQSKKRVGRGNGSGAGTYSGRGMKGQTARSGGKRKAGFEGGQMSYIRRMPKLKGFKNPNQVKFQVVNVSELNIFEDGEEVDIVRLYEKNLISKNNQPVKILGNGELTKKLTVKAERISLSAQEKITKAKGSFTELMPKIEKTPKATKETNKKTDKQEEIEENAEEKSK